MGIPIDNGSIGLPNAGGNRERGSDPTTRRRGSIPSRPPGPREGSTAPLARQASPVRPPDHRFSVDGLRAAKSADAARQSAVAPGKGAIPVTPAAGSDPVTLPKPRGGR